MICCPRCKIEMRKGFAIGDGFKRPRCFGRLFNYDADTLPIAIVMKCPGCGHSESIDGEEPSLMKETMPRPLSCKKCPGVDFAPGIAIDPRISGIEYTTGRVTPKWIASEDVSIIRVWKCRGCGHSEYAHTPQFRNDGEYF